MTRFLALLVGLLIGVAATAAPAGESFGDLPDDPVAAWAEVSQRVLPDLEARQESATRRKAAREAFFAGQGSLEEAFPDLAQARLGSDTVLQGRLLALDDRAVKRAGERMTALPALGSPAQERALQEAWTAALDAEEAADGLERRFLLAMRAFGARHPELTDKAVDEQRQQLRDASRVAEALQAVATTDEEKAAAARRVARLDDDRVRLEELVAGLRVAGVVPGAAVPSPASELERLKSQADDAWALQRLALLRPFLGPEAAAEVDRAERAWLAETRIPELGQALVEAQDSPAPSGLEPEALEQRIEQARTAVEDARSRLDGVPTGEAGSLLALRRAAADLEVRIAEARLMALERASASVADVVDSTATEAERARAEARQATAAAEEAREGAQDAVGVRIAELQAEAASARERAADAWEATRALEESLQEGERIRQEDLGKLSSRAAEVDSRLGIGRDEADAVYADLRALVKTLRQDVTDAIGIHAEQSISRSGAATQVQTDREALRQARTEARALDDADRVEVEAVLGRWDAGLGDEERAHDEAVELAREHRDALVRLLRSAKETRRKVKPEISWSERRQDRAVVLVELSQEVRLAWVHILSGVRGRLRALVGLPRALLDFNVLMGTVRGSLFTLLVAVAWGIARRRVDDVASFVLTRIRKANPRYRPVDLLTLRDPLERFARSLLDWALGWLLLRGVYGLLPELGVALRIFLYVVTLRLVLATFDLAFVRHPERRIGLLALPAATYDLARRSVRLFVTWWLVRGFLRFLLLDILDFDALDQLVRFILNWVGVGLLVWLLHRWEPILRSRMARMYQGTGLVRRLSVEPPHWTLHALHSLVILGYLGAASAWTVLNRLARQREGLGRLLNVLSRYRMKGEAEKTKDRAPISKELREALLVQECPNGGYVSREEVDGALDKALGAWRREARKGLVALVGDRGMGKHTTLDRLVERVGSGTDLVVHRGRVVRRVVSEADALGWIAEALGMPESAVTPEACVEALNAFEPSLMTLEGSEQAFLRTVNGFEGLRTLLYILNATAHRHFWVLTIHRPAWRYLSLLGSLVNTEVFRAVVLVPAMGEDQLRPLIQARLQANGHTADFSGLVRTNPFGADPDVELERTISSFYRLLAEASGGNPAIALDMFTRCLSPGEAEGTVEVFMDTVLELEQVAELTETDLFTLVALRTQDTLDEAELVRVTNMAPGAIKTTVKHLEQRGLLQVVEGRIQIVQSQLAAVTRTLRRRNFMQG